MKRIDWLLEEKQKLEHQLDTTTDAATIRNIKQQLKEDAAEIQRYKDKK